MKLANKTLYKLVHGAVQMKEMDKGYVSFYRFSDEQIEYFKFNDFYYPRTKFPASVTIEFKTNADSFSFKYKIGYIGSKDSIDVYVNNLAYQFFNIEDINEKGTIEVNLPKGEKEVHIYLPIDCEIEIKDLTINGNYKKVVRKEKMLCFGDSITHGFGSYKSSLIYVDVMNRQMGYEILNQGIGGYYYDRNQVVSTPLFNPDKILIALGTNQIHSTDTLEQITDFYKKINEEFPNIPMFVLTPIWRGDHKDGEEQIAKIKQMIISQAKNYPNMYVIDGDILVPHMDYYYSDLLHPNALGMEVYGNNLVKEIKKIIKREKIK